MKLRTWLTATLGAAALGLVAAPAEAAPASSLGAFKDAGAQTRDAEPAHWYGRRYRYRDNYHPGFRFYYGPRYHRRHWHHRHW